MQNRAHTGARLTIAIVGLSLLVLFALVVGKAKALAEARPRPSFVVIQTDDQTLDELYAARAGLNGSLLRAMPNTLDLIAKRGITFNRYYASYSLCAPSRVSLLTGRYAHNNNDRGNVQPDGGYSGFASRGAYSQNIATWLQGAGYRTIHIGKFLNGYGEPPGYPAEVPPGWSSWHTVLNADTDHYFYGYTLNNNGVVEGPYGESGSWETREYGERDDLGCPFAPLNGKPCYYQTDVLDNFTTEELRNTPAETPFYLQLDYSTPHGDFRRPAGPEPPPRYYNWFSGTPLPHNRAQGLDEGNINDKPSFLREAPYLSPSELHIYRVYYDKCLEALRGVDDGVKQIVDTLGSLHRLRNTYIIFTSDNGFFFGEHRLIGGKFLAYEPSTHLPLLMRGPGIKPGGETGEMAANIDIAPTVLELAGVDPGKSLDGRSLFPYAQDTALRTRRPVLFESFVQSNDVEDEGQGRVSAAARTSAAARRQKGASASIVAPPKNYYGIRLGPYKYIEWPDGEKELYDINTDPYELNNQVREPNLYPIRNFLRAELLKLETCMGRTCREPSAKLPLTRAQQLKLKREHEREQRERERERKRKEKHRGG